MKKIVLLISIVLMLSSCAHLLLRIPETTNHYGVVLTKYSDSNFFITTDKEYKGKYTPVGILHTTISPELTPKFQLVGSTFNWDGSYYVDYIPDSIKQNYTVCGSYFYKNINLKNCVEKFYEYSINIGADAIVNFSYNIEYKLNPEKDGLYPVITVSGFAIKREE